MADIVDIANRHDFSEERLLAMKRQPEVERGKCLFCLEAITEKIDGKLKLYCDSECRSEYEHVQAIKSRQRRM